ncbi:MAG: hypothetical protein R3F17_14555 [Planctomycetota bacterium]
MPQRRTPSIVLLLAILAAVSLWHFGFRGRPTAVAAFAAPQIQAGLGPEDPAAHLEERNAYMRFIHTMPRGTRWTYKEMQNTRRRFEQRAEADPDDFLRGVDSRWSEVGPDSQSGQTRSLAIAADGTLFLGMANGGLWRGHLDGARWLPLTDAVGGGVDEVHLCEGPGFQTLIQRHGTRLVVSRNGGEDWSEPAGLEALMRAMRLVNDGANRIWLLGAVGRGSALQTALLVSEDQAASFRVVHTFGEYWRGDLLLDPSETSGTRLLILHSRELLVWDILSGTLAPLARAEVPARQGVLASGGGPQGEVYVALDTDNGWRLYATSAPHWALDRRADLDECNRNLCAARGAPGQVFTGAEILSASHDGGREFQPAQPGGSYFEDPQGHLHPGVRGLQCLRDPRRPDQDLLVVHTDGGTWLSRDFGRSFARLPMIGLRAGQALDTLTSRRGVPWLWAATQDQGLQGGFYDRLVDGDGPAQLRPWVNGDYGSLVEIAPRGTFSGGVLAAAPGYVLWFHGRGEVAPEFLALPEHAQTLWMPPLYADPQDTQAAWLLAERIYRYLRGPQGRWTVQPFGNLEAREQGAQRLVAMGCAPGATTVYVADDAGGLHRSLDGGRTFEPRGRTIETRPANDQPPQFVLARCLWVDPAGSETVWVGGTGYSGPGVLVSNDGGQTFRSPATGLPPTLVRELALGVDGQMYAATDAGPWVLDQARSRWMGIEGRRAPNTVFTSVEPLDQGRVLRFATFGRGVWDYVVGPSFGSGAGDDQ